MGIPDEFRGVRKGQWLTVKQTMFNRSGKDGLVVSIHDVGVSLDFFTCGQCGAKSCPCYASIEFWEWGELEPMHEPCDCGYSEQTPTHDAETNEPFAGLPLKSFNLPAKRRARDSRD